MATGTASPNHILPTKLYPPRVPAQLIRRQKLLDRLLLEDFWRLTLVSAPAGYGKSVLVTQWLREMDAPYAWLSLDAYDSGLDTVAAYLVASLHNKYPAMGSETGQILQRPQLPAPERLADTLLRDLQTLPGPVTLVIDDYHTISNIAVHHFFQRLLSNMPPQMRLIILSRVDPPLALSRLRGGGQMRDIRANDLRFSDREAATLITQIVDKPVGGDTVCALNEWCEGWPVGLRMAAFSLRGVDDQAQFIRRAAAGGSKQVSDYLLGEVLERLPAEQRLLLLRTAVVDRFCAPLIDALAEGAPPGSSGHDFLQALWSSNFFTIALDDQGVWYRFHHLFRQLLVGQVGQTFSAEAVSAMHFQASAWFEEAGYIEDAIIHARQAGAPDRAARLVEQYVHEAVNEEDWRPVDRWINLLPEEARQRPGILATRAMVEQLRFRVGSIPPLLDAAEQGLKSKRFDYTPDQEAAWMGVINTFRASTFLPSQSPQDCLRYAEQALCQVDPSARYVRSLAEFWQIYALQQSGDPRQAISAARRKIAGQVSQPDVRTHRLLLAEAATHLAELDVPGLYNRAHAYRDLAFRTGHQVSLGWATFFLGWCAYQRNDLKGAEIYFEEVLAARLAVHGRAAIDAIIGMALVHAARGDQPQAIRTLDLLRDFIMEQGIMSLISLVDSLTARLKDRVSVPDLGSDHREQWQAQMASDLWELPVLTTCRLDIESADPQRLAAAHETLANCRTFAQSRNAKRQLLQIGILQALLHEALGDHQRALDRLREAVLLAEPGGALRYFVDEGRGPLPLLVQLKKQGTAVDFIDRVLAVYGPASEQTAAASEQTAAAAAGQARSERTLSPQAVALIAELTNREMEVLLLLADRLTNKEIAAELHISPRTVKKHTINLYQKMEVDGRRQAAARARELGVL